MKKFLKYTGTYSLVLAIVAFVLLLTTNATSISRESIYSNGLKGTVALFGYSRGDAFLSITYKPSLLSLIGWILIIVAISIILQGVILSIFKVNALRNVAGILNIIAAVCLISAGVFIFFVVPTFYNANQVNPASNESIGLGWVLAGVFSIVAGIFTILPAIGNFIDKK